MDGIYGPELRLTSDELADLLGHPRARWMADPAVNEAGEGLAVPWLEG